MAQLPEMFTITPLTEPIPASTSSLVNLLPELDDAPVSMEPAVPAHIAAAMASLTAPVTAPVAPPITVGPVPSVGAFGLPVQDFTIHEAPNQIPAPAIGTEIAPTLPQISAANQTSYPDNRSINYNQIVWDGGVHKGPIKVCGWTAHNHKICGAILTQPIPGTAATPEMYIKSQFDQLKYTYNSYTPNNYSKKENAYFFKVKDLEVMKALLSNINAHYAKDPAAAAAIRQPDPPLPGTAGVAPVVTVGAAVLPALNATGVATVGAPPPLTTLANQAPPSIAAMDPMEAFNRAKEIAAAKTLRATTGMGAVTNLGIFMDENEIPHRQVMLIYPIPVVGKKVTVSFSGGQLDMTIKSIDNSTNRVQVEGGTQTVTLILVNGSWTVMEMITTPHEVKFSK